MCSIKVQFSIEYLAEKIRTTTGDERRKYIKEIRRIRRLQLAGIIKEDL